MQTEKNNMYFAVTTLNGHVGLGKAIPITYPMIAASRKEAVDKILGRNSRKKRSRVKVKPSGKATVLSAVSIDHEQFEELVMKNREDQYLNATCVQDQRRFTTDLDSRIIVLFDKYAEKYERLPRVFETYSGKIPVKNTKAYLRYHEGSGLSFIRGK